MRLGFPVFRRAAPKQSPGNIKLGMSQDMLGNLLKRELLVVWLFFPVVLLVFFLLVPVVLGKEGKEGIPELLFVITGVFQQLIQLDQVGYSKVQTLQEHQGGQQDGY